MKDQDWILLSGFQEAFSQDVGSSSPLVITIMENLEEDLTCSVCYSLFNDPRVLPCSHTFCKTCLDNVLQLSTNFSIWRPLRLPLKCPNCRSMVELPPNGVEALPINVCLRAIIEKYQRDNEPRVPSCPEHHRQPLNVYCVQDCKLICGLCLTIGQHQGHTIDDLQTAYVKERNTPAKLVERLTDRHWEEVCGLVDKLEQEKSRQERLIKQDREAVIQYFQGLERLLEQKKEAFMKVLDNANKQLACAYKPLIEKLKYMKEEQLEIISIISSISEDESALVFLEMVRHLRERVDVLTQTELPDAPELHISPCLEEFLEEHWAKVTIGGLEDGPVPEISCDVKRPLEPKSASSQKCTFKSLIIVAFLIALLFFLFFWSNVLYGASFEFSSLPQISQIVSRLAGELSYPVHGSGNFLYCLLHDLGLNINYYISAVRESTIQHVAFLFKTLRLC
ncbi:tripartite motif-containing protein 59 isoform X2 [Tachysurus fulvidraco]|uniref:tripartite motif-containing protein 59 isoform X2 n=1 Tax=Tachysurus fulvidraco TaxID=1234273 RepID=UPI001FEE9DBD|nr:tripartite motif-containing protein 59 isoform X2 [Tachysurus fulvidraco]XP_047662543.1 tripartite motif-containing protein 59 isoform X2 [Tachysurus fulvidraco]